MKLKFFFIFLKSNLEGSYLITKQKLNDNVITPYKEKWKKFNGQSWTNEKKYKKRLKKTDLSPLKLKCKIYDLVIILG
jgi:hypothetical protein